MIGNRLPVLRRELVQQAASKRTYVVRCVYACLFFLLFFSLAMDTLRFYRNTDVLEAIAAMGRGGELLEQVCMLQFLGAYLFLPALMAGAIAHEKERHSFPLLLATRLTPTEILLQKYVSRLIPMLTFLVLTLPVLGVAYLMGGLEASTVAWSACYLLVHCLQVGALALLCSTIARTFVGALIGCYLVYGGYALGMIVLDAMGGVDAETALALVTPYAFVHSDAPATANLVRLLPIALSALAFLGTARLFLVRRANPRSHRLIPRLFAWLDSVMVRWNERWARGIVLVKDVASTPGRQPVAWREKKRATLGRPQYVVRLMLVLEALVFLGSLAAITEMTGLDGEEWLALMLCALWICAALTVCVHSVNLFGAERTHRTLDILMSTPLDAREIVRQKMQPLRRILLVFLVPFVTLFFLHAYLEELVYGRVTKAVTFVILSIGTVLVYLPLTAWTACLVGIRMRKRARAIVTALILLFAWVMGPVILCIVLQDIVPVLFDGDDFLFLSPVGVIGELVFDLDLWDLGEVFLIIVNLLANLALFAIVRGCSLVCADRCLRRS